MGKPIVYYEPSGPSGNIFAIAAQVTKAMRIEGCSPEKIRETQERMVRAGSYEEAIRIFEEFVELRIGKPY